MIWIILVFSCMAAAVFYMKMQARAERERREPDEGQAILDFGRAFPNEAIRAIHATADDKAYFVRLHDGKAGFMLSHGTHFVCYLFEPGKVVASRARSDRGLDLHFADVSSLDGVFEFTSAEIAAEVSLWLLGSFSPQSEFTLPPAH